MKIMGNGSRIKSLFETYFDGGHEIDPQPNTFNTYTMGVCKLDFDEENNTLTITSKVKRTEEQIWI